MACSISRSLLAAAVALVVGASLLAQGSPLKEACNSLRLGQKDACVEKLKEILAGDPSNEDALTLYRSINQDEWYMLVTEKGELGQIAQSLFARAKVERRERSRDDAAIRQLVAAALDGGNDHNTRQAAINKLISEHAEFAVPPLAEKLGDADDEEGQVRAVYALNQLGAVAVLPLIELLKSDNELAVQNAAAALHHIGDSRAHAYMLHLANDSRTGVSTIANAYLAKRKLSGDGLLALLDDAQAYLKGHVPAGGFSGVVWNLVEGKLVATDVPAVLFASELAKVCARDAVRMAPDSLPARSALAQANLGQANLIEASIAQGDASVQSLQGVAADLKIAALASGVDSLRGALESGMALGLQPVALGAIAALAEVENFDSFSQSALINALVSTDKRIRYAAAEALVRATEGNNVPAAESVVEVLAQAVGEESVRYIQVIGETEASKAAIAASNSKRGLAVEASGNAVNGIRNLLLNPTVDVVVIHEILPDGLPEDVIGNIKKDGRMNNARILVVAKDVEAAQTRFGEGVTCIQGPLTSENLLAAVGTALEGTTTPAGVRAESYAQGASAALLSMAKHKALVGPALANLAAQLNRGDAVAVPAAQTLGVAGGQEHVAALVAALSGAGSAELKIAAAVAMGEILARLDGCEDSTLDALVAVVTSEQDAKVRGAAASALSRAKVDVAKKSLLQKRLSKVAGVSTAE